MKNIVLLFLILLLGDYSKAEDIVLGVLYLGDPYAHLHQNPIIYSHSLTTLGCGHPVKLLERKKLKAGWVYAQVGANKGYLRSSQLVNKKPSCFKLKYPKFYRQLDLDLSEMYYWGKLHDQFIKIKTNVEAK